MGISRWIEYYERINGRFSIFTRKKRVEQSLIEMDYCYKQSVASHFHRLYFEALSPVIRIFDIEKLKILKKNIFLILPHVCSGIFSTFPWRKNRTWVVLFVAIRIEDCLVVHSIVALQFARILYFFCYGIIVKFIFFSHYSCTTTAENRTWRRSSATWP